MRKLEYLSPTSIAVFKQNQEDYYLRYLSENRPTRDKQTQPMSIGSAFDAYVKSWMHESLFGKGNDPRFDLRTLFEAQVEKHHWDWAFENGRHAFDCYKHSGALADLMMELEQSVGTPRFEIEVRGVVNGQKEGVTRSMSGVTFLGKPDVSFNHKSGINITLDFKVNGYCSKTGISPMPGYTRIRGAEFTGPHKNCFLAPHHGMLINRDQRLEDLKEDWAVQLAIYGWLCGNEVGSDFITAIDQLVCKPGTIKPSIRVAEHRLRISEEFQWATFTLAQQIWDIVQSDHIFRNMTLEQSQARCKTLDQQSMGMRDEDFEAICRSY